MIREQQAIEKQGLTGKYQGIVLTKGQLSDDCRAALWMLWNTFQIMVKLTWSAIECEKHPKKGPHKSS